MRDPYTRDEKGDNGQIAFQERAFAFGHEEGTRVLLKVTLSVRRNQVGDLGRMLSGVARQCDLFQQLKIGRAVAARQAQEALQFVHVSD